jgi:hypothetical protein
MTDTKLIDDFHQGDVVRNRNTGGKSVVRPGGTWLIRYYELVSCPHEHAAEGRRRPRDDGRPTVNRDRTIIEPDEILTHSGEQVAHWGQVDVVKMGEPSDPIPSVYASSHRLGGEIEFAGEYRMSLDEAEQMAARIANAVRWQRARHAQQRAAELNEMATGAAATHDWHQPDRNRGATCRRCRLVVLGGDELLIAGVMPTCGTPCPMSWHEISAAASSDDGDATCIFCKTSWSAEHLYVLKDVRGLYLAVGPFLTFDQAARITQAATLFVPFRLPRAEALAEVGEAKRREAAVVGESRG